MLCCPALQSEWAMLVQCQRNINQDAMGVSADTLHSCLAAKAKLELHHSHCSLAPPATYSSSQSGLVAC